MPEQLGAPQQQDRLSRAEVQCVDMLARMMKQVMSSEDRNAAYVSLTHELTLQGVPSLLIVDLRNVVKHGVEAVQTYTRMRTNGR
jgi:hypothetical protein